MITKIKKDENVLFIGAGKRWVHRDPPLGKVKVIYGGIKKEIIGHLRRWPITGLDKLLSGHGNNKVL